MVLRKTLENLLDSKEIKPACCFDDHNIAVQSEVKGCDSSSIFRSQDCFSYLFFWFVCFSIQIVKIFKLFCAKHPWKYARDCIVSADCFGYYSYIHNISSSNPRTWHISPSVCVIFYFFHQCHSFMHTGLLSP